MNLDTIGLCGLVIANKYECVFVFTEAIFPKALEKVKDGIATCEETDEYLSQYTALERWQDALM